MIDFTAQVRAFVTDWFGRLDKHCPSAEMELLVDEQFLMTVPEGNVTGRDGFRRWYEIALSRFFDEVHTLNRVEIDFPESPAKARVRLELNWQARFWVPGSARSGWLGFDAAQTWTIIRGRAGTPVLVGYKVTRFDPMPNSVDLDSVPRLQIAREA